MSTGLDGVVERLEKKVGKVQVSGRYHRAPKEIEDDYNLLQTVLGDGYNGKVYVAENKLNGRQFAVKGFKLIGVSAKKKEELETEAEVFLAMDHPHVCRLVDIYESEEKLDLVMECLTGGELFDRIEERKRFSERDAADAAWQMLLALNYIHRHGVVHRDIKLENWLYESKTSDHLKLIDFGFSKIFTPDMKFQMSCGTLAYVAPEVLNKSYTSQCDMWSLGVTVFVLLFGHMPFHGSQQDQISAIKNGKYTRKEQIWQKVSEPGQDFVAKLLLVNPDNRPTAKQALEHEWVVGRAKAAGSHINKETVMAMAGFVHASRFRRACMNMMAWSLSSEERALVRDGFIEMDTDHSGTLTLVEFKRVLEEQFEIDDAQTLEAFHALDSNSDDEIHYSDFLAALVSTRLRMHDDLLKAAFKRFDTDNSGMITVQNLEEVFGRNGDDVEQMLRDVDISKDGQISLEEFMIYLRNSDSDDQHACVIKVVDEELGNQKDLQPKMRTRNSKNPTTTVDEQLARKQPQCQSCCSVQ